MIPPIARQFVAGEDQAAAVERAEELARRDVGTILNLLGEHYHDRGPADGDAAAYRELVAKLASHDHACVSVKPSQIGLDVGANGERPTEAGERAFRENLASVVEAGREHGVFTWVDMEDHPTTDATLDAVEALATEHGGGVGVCLQANLRRTEEDLRRLADVPGKVRLVKGAYDEPREVAYKQKSRVDESYRSLLRVAFEEFDDGVAVGSHDPAMIELATDLHEEHGTGFEVQMLMGVREDAQFELAEEHDVYQYVPYGEKWFSYFYRRVRERKENLLFAARAVLGV